MSGDDNKALHRKIKVPDFKSNLPSTLLKQLSERERYLYETLSKMEQAIEWCAQTIVEVNENSTDVNSRLRPFEDARDLLRRPIVAAAAVGAMMAPLIVVALEIYKAFSSKGSP